jgi:IclR family transcriptional regulator, acetate operon repressor
LNRQSEIADPPVEPEKANPVESLVTVTRTMQIIEMLAGDGRGLSLADIARRLDVNKSIAVRILNTLEEANYVFRGVENQRYFLTYKISRVGLGVLIANRFMEQIQPRLRQLADACGELVLLSTIQEDGPQWVMAARGDAGRRLQVDPLIRSSLHSTATGKAWLATLPDAEVERRVGNTFAAVTPHTVTTLEALRAQLETVRRQGYAISDQENEAGIKAISVPIRRGPEGARDCVGFVSITAPISRASEADYERFGRLLLEAAQYLGDIWLPQEAADFGAPRTPSSFQILD